VASIIAGNSSAVQGVAPDADILSIKVLDDNGEGDTFTLAMGIVEAVDMGADIINLSLGSYGTNSTLESAVNYAFENDVAIIAASGNDGLEGVTYPARYAQVIAVGGVDPTEQHAGFSNRGSEIDLTAPATGVYAAWPGDKIVSFSGTSVSAAFVTGTLADVMAQDPRLSANEAMEVILNHTIDAGAPGWDPEIGAGILNIARIQDKDQRGLFDIALASHYLEQSDVSDKDIFYIVSAQNRGTEPLSAVALTTEIDGHRKSFEFNQIGVGETVSEQLLLDQEMLRNAGSIEVNSSVRISGLEDSNPKNNEKSSIIIFASPEEDNEE
jgi:subtilisin family serine protease